MFSFIYFQTTLLTLSIFAATTQAVEVLSSSPAHLIASRNHRRHHARRDGVKRRHKITHCLPGQTSRTSTNNSTTDSLGEEYASSDASNITTNQRSSTTSAASSTMGLPSGSLAHGGIAMGFLPDEADAGGTRTLLTQINKALGATSSSYGWYAQAHSGTLFDGSQLLAILSDVKASKAVFQPAVMPVGGWKGLTSSDNSQAVAIAKVMKKFTDEGIPVWLRFAHEMNYYQTDGTYNGNAADFKAGWAAVAAACKQYAPDVKMWWTPNVASDSSYAAYEPTDMSTVDLVGIDYYPKSISKGTEFVNTMKAFHDKYAVHGRMFAIGETGLGYGGSMTDRISWLNQVMSSKAQLPNMISASWFNYQKDYDYKIVEISNDSLNHPVKQFFGLN